MAADVRLEQWRRLESAFHAALAAPAAGRDKVVLDLCQGDQSLLLELRNLLASFEQSSHFQAPAREATTAPSVLLEAKEFRLDDVGGYELDKEIGEGGMGTVYLAHRSDGEFNQQVALKVVSPHLRTSFFTERFRTERQILANLNHPNITRLLDGGVSTKGDPYLVMEYVEGEPITGYCDKRLMSVPDRVRLFLQVCSAVEYAHRNLVVHRDLKPANVFVTASGTVKLLDFGTAKLLMTGLHESTTTRFGALTPRYASPEQLRGESVSTSMDVYSLGVMLYEMICGAWPFGDPNSPVAGLERAVREVAPAAPHLQLSDDSARLRSSSRPKLARLLEGDLRNIIFKALETSTRRRYSSVEQFSADLRCYLEAKPVQAREQTWWYRSARFVQRHGWQLSLATALIACVFASGFVLLRQYGREQRRMVQVRELSQSYLTDILSEVGKLPGSMKARLLIVDRARRNLDQLLPDAPNDPELRRALAGAYLQLGDIQAKPFSVSLGDTNGALMSYRKTESLVSGGSPNDWDLLAKLVSARMAIAVIETRSGRYREAISLLHSALEPARRIWKEGPRNLQYDGQPAAALYANVNLRIGHAMLNADDAASTTPHFEILAQLQNAVAISEQIQAEHPGMRDLAGIISQYEGFALEGLAGRTGDKTYFQQAVAAHRRGEESACRDFEAKPNPQTQRNCADGFGELSWALHNAGDGESAVEAASRALALMQPVSNAEPNSIEAQRDLANAYFHLGAAECSAGKFKDAVADLQTAESRLGPVKQVAADDPLETVGLFVHIQRQLSQAQLEMNDVRAAIRSLQRAILAAEKNPKLAGPVLSDLRNRLAHAKTVLASQTRPAGR